MRESWAGCEATRRAILGKHTRDRAPDFAQRRLIQGRSPGSPVNAQSPNSVPRMRHSLRAGRSGHLPGWSLLAWLSCSCLDSEVDQPVLEVDTTTECRTGSVDRLAASYVQRSKYSHEGERLPTVRIGDNLWLSPQTRVPHDVLVSK